MENQEIVERRARITDLGREGVGRLHGKARPEQPVIERHIAERYRARRGVADFLAEAEVLEKIAWIGLGDGRFTHAKAPSSDPARLGSAILTKP